ncbi:MAG: PKD domain-containing protein, partial [Candidatus Eiseniibacteriota bacterium]
AAYAWDFGDGATGSGVMPVHAYTDAGTYTVTLEVTDDGGLSSSCSTTARIQEPGQEACPRNRAYWRTQCERPGYAATICEAGMEYLFRCAIDATGVDSWHVQEGVFESTMELQALTDAELAMRLCAQLDGPRPVTLRDKTEYDYLAVQLSVCVGALPLDTLVELPGYFSGTVAEAIALIESAINSGVDLEPAGYLAKEISTGEALMAPPCEDPEAIYGNVPGCTEPSAMTGTSGRKMNGESMDLLGAPGAIGAPTALLARVHPNPNLRGSTAVTFTVTPELDGSEVRVAVYDVRGRLVRQLVDGSRAAGFHTVQWDLTDSGGTTVATGVYLFRVTVGNHQTTVKHLVVRR